MSLYKSTYRMGGLCMNLQYLKYVIEIFRTGSITKAAENLYMAQPNLSAALRDMENEIGIKIFIRTTKGVVPTPEGKDFLTYAQSIIDQVEVLESHYSKQKISQINFCISSVRSSMIAEEMASYINGLSNNSGINIRLRECAPFEVINDVNEGFSDMGYLILPENQCEYFMKFLKDKKLCFEQIASSRARILIKKDHPLVNDPNITFAKLTAYIEVVHGDFRNPSLNEKNIKMLKNIQSSSPRKIVCIYDRGTLLNMLFKIHGSYLWSGITHPDVISRNDLIERFCEDTHVQVNEFIIFKSSLYDDENLGKLRKLIIDSRIKFSDD